MTLLDIRTLLVVLMVSNVLMAAVIWVGSRGRLRDGLGKWVVSLLIQGLAWLLMAPRNEICDFLSIPVGNAILVLSWSLQGGAISDFQQRKMPRSVYTVPPVVIFLLFWAMIDDPHFRLGFSGVAYGIGETALGILALSRAGGASLYTRGLLSAAYFAIAIVMMIRGLAVIIAPGEFSSLFSPHLTQTVTFVAGFIAVIVSSIGLLLMHKERAEEKIHLLATTDSLTGLYNRRTFVELAARELARGRRAKQPISLLMFDLDLFKRVNDTHGHQTGDRVLVEFSRLVQGCLRREDLLVRYGGEEFCVLLPGIGLERAGALAQRVRSLVEQTPIDINGRHLSITVSCGVTTITPDFDIDLEAALAVADDALYKAKREGRNRVSVKALSIS